MDAKKRVSIFLWFFSVMLASGQHGLKIELPSQEWKLSYSLWHTSPESASIEANKVLLDGQSLGYLQAHFDSTFSDSAQSYFRISSGPKYHWAQLATGNLSPEVLDELRLRKLSQGKKPFSLAKISELYKKLIEYYENIGHPFARIGLLDISESNDSLYATLQLDPGPLVLYDSVVVKGYEKIGTALPRYEWRIREGALYRQRDMDRLTERINSSAHLTASRDPVMLFTEEINVLYLYIEKRKASQFDGIIGFASKPDGGISANGNVMLDLVNSFNKGEEIRFHWTSPGNQTQTLNTYLKLLYIFKLPITPEASFLLVKQDSTFLRADYMAGLNFRLSSPLSFRFFYEGRTANNLQSSSTNNLSYESDFLGFGLDFLNLNDRYVPTKGIDIKSDILIGENQKDGIIKYQWMYRMTGAYYRQLVPRNVIKIGAQAGFISNATLESEFFRYGGLLTLRGFNEQQFFTSQYTTGTLEYRFMIDPKSFLLAFSDISQLELSDSIDPTARLLSFGAGLSLNTSSGVFNITWAVGSNLGEAINFSDSKIHFGYTNRF